MRRSSLWTGGWPGLQTAEATTAAGAPSFAQCAKGGYHGRMRNRVCAKEKELRRQHRDPPLQRTQGWGTLCGSGVGKTAKVGHPRNFNVALPTDVAIKATMLHMKHITSMKPISCTQRSCISLKFSNFGTKNNFQNEPKTLVDDAVDKSNCYKYA